MMVSHIPDTYMLTGIECHKVAEASRLNKEKQAMEIHKEQRAMEGLVEYYSRQGQEQASLSVS